MKPHPNAELVKVDGRVFWSTGGHVIWFIESFCVFTNGRWLGQPFILFPWQRKLLYELFEVDPDTGLRVYRRALIGIARKSGKSEVAAALALYFMLADDEPSAAVYCAAASEEQAEVVFEAAKRMCEVDGAPLADMVLVEKTKLSSVTDPYSFIKLLSSKGATKHGLNVHAVILDELHAWGVGQGNELWAALTTGSAAREQPMQIAITTAGANLDESRCGDLYKLGRRVEAGEVDANGFFFRWWQAPDGCDYKDPEMWALASPSYGLTVKKGFYEGELYLPEADFRRLYLNQWVDWGAAQPFVTRDQWDACDVGGFAFRTGEPMWVGVDLSETRDSTAVAYGQMWGDDLMAKARTWERPLHADGRPLAEWEVPQAEVKDFIRSLAREYDVVTVVFDPWHSKLMRQDLEAEGIPCEEMWQTGKRRAGASAALFERIVTRRLRHDGDPVLSRHIMNATIKSAGDEGFYVAKRKKGRVMDATMALVNVTYGTMYAEAKAPVQMGIVVI